MKQFLIGLLYENNSPSLTRVISVVAFLAFLAGSAYLILKNQTWAHYETFAAITGGGGVTSQVVNKYINSVKNSQPGVFPEKTGGDYK